MNHLDSLFSEIGDYDDNQADDGEHSAYVGYPCQSKVVRFRKWWVRVDVLPRRNGRKEDGLKL